MPNKQQNKYILKEMRNPRTKDNQKALIVKKLAEKHTKTKAYIYLVIDGERNNDEILADYMELTEGLKNYFDNAFLTAVNNLVPFN